MTKTSKGTWAGIAMLALMWFTVLWRFSEVRDAAIERADGVMVRAVSNTQRIEKLEAAPTRPATVSVEWLGLHRVQMTAETGPGEARPAFAADVVGMYKTLNQEIQ